MFRLVLPLLICFTTCCRSVPPQVPDVVAIQALYSYKSLSNKSKRLVNDIMVLVENNPNKEYYYKKLRLLLNTPYFDAESNKVNIREHVVKEATEEVTKIRKSKTKEELKKYMNIEEEYEKSVARVWYSYCDTKYSNGKCFYVTQDPLDILIRIHINVNGEPEDIKKILFMEDAAEKHLSIPGFSVNIVFFINEEGKDKFQIDSNPYRWTTNVNWTGDYKAMAHEAMHLFGLEDDYDRIEQHADNKYMPIKDRLEWFKFQIEHGSSDSKDGIMFRSWLKPLDRHACAAAGMDEECVKKRMEYFHGRK